MKRRNVIVPALVIVLVAFSLTGFNQSSYCKRSKTGYRAIKKKQNKVTNIDDAIDEVDRGFSEIDKVDMGKVKKEIEAAVKNIDTAKIKMEIDKSLRDVNFSQAKAEIEKAMKEIDSEKLKAKLQ
ncbi:MAG: hypothetical protein C4330_09235 [Chitinophagaceae bacterium]